MLHPFSEVLYNFSVIITLFMTILTHIYFLLTLHIDYKKPSTESTNPLKVRARAQETSMSNLIKYEIVWPHLITFHSLFK